MAQHRQLEPWGGEVKVPRMVRWLLRRPPEPGDSRERAHERRQPEYPEMSVLENVDRAVFGPFSEGHPANRAGRGERPRGGLYD